jgi:hypothetical protein
MSKAINKSFLSIAAAAAFAFGASAAQADDVGFGLGVSYVFGSGFAVGVKAFSNDEDNETVAALGLDYLVQAGAFRPNIGVAYQGEGYYTDANVGYNLGTGAIDFGFGGGASDSDDERKDPAAAPIPEPI